MIVLALLALAVLPLALPLLAFAFPLWRRIRPKDPLENEEIYN